MYPVPELSPGSIQAVTVSAPVRFRLGGLPKPTHSPPANETDEPASVAVGAPATTCPPSRTP